jgi:hypothetical protein
MKLSALVSASKSHKQKKKTETENRKRKQKKKTEKENRKAKKSKENRKRNRKSSQKTKQNTFTISLFFNFQEVR